MPIEKVTELKTEPVVGKFYLVPCVSYHGEWLPITGHAHADSELEVPAEHYHKDVRFLSPSKTNYELANRGEEMGAVHELKIVPPSIYCGQIQWRKMKCRRVMPTFPYFPRYKNNKPTVYAKMHTKYIGKKTLCGKCPHRGMPLESLPKDSNGIVICNGHGLAIDMNKGEVVKRA